VPRSKNAWSYTFTPPHTSMAWCSVKAPGQLYLYLSIIIIMIIIMMVENPNSIMEDNIKIDVRQRG
jgi:hypothetical protein